MAKDIKKVIRSEYIKCAQDPVHFMRKYCYIQHPQRGRIQFNLYPFQEVNLLKDQIKLYDDRLKQVDKWYKKPWVGVVGGVIGTLITIHVLDYSLPQ